MTTRRTFLGQVLGTIIGTQIPFIAKRHESEPKELSLIDLYKQRIQMLEADESVFKLYRIRLHLDTGEIIRGPRIKEVTRIITHSQADVSYVCEYIKMSRRAIITRYDLIDDQNNLIQSSCGTIILGKDDHLAITGEMGLIVPMHYFKPKGD